MSEYHISTQVLHGNALFSGKNYTTGNNFTQPPVATVATNFKSAYDFTFSDRFQTVRCVQLVANFQDWNFQDFFTWLLILKTVSKLSVFRSARTSYRASVRPPVPSIRANFSWVHRWAVTLPSDLRDPSNHTFSESPWCQLSNFGRNFKYRDKYKDKYRDKYKDRDK